MVARVVPVPEKRMIKIMPFSHTDHGLSAGVTEYVLAEAARTYSGSGLVLAVIPLPAELGTVPCGLYGPAEGDAPVDETEVSYRVRPPRSTPSRMIRRPMRPVRSVVVIAGPVGDEGLVLFTAYGGSAVAEREPATIDPAVDPDGHRRAVSFWAQHALSDET